MREECVQYSFVNVLRPRSSHRELLSALSTARVWLSAQMAFRPSYTFKLGRGGNGYLCSKMNSWYQMAQQQVVAVLTDLDQANCLVEFRDQWLVAEPPQNLLLRIAVREVESWVLADHVAMRTLIGAKGVLPAAPGSGRWGQKS